VVVLAAHLSTQPVSDLLPLDVAVLPSLTSYKSQSPGRNLRGTSRLDPNRTIWDFKIIADLDTKSK
jgi:hypothetical protein